MMLVLINADQIAECVQVCLGSVIKVSLGQQAIHDMLSGLEVLIGTNGTEFAGQTNAKDPGQFR